MTPQGAIGVDEHRAVTSQTGQYCSGAATTDLVRCFYDLAKSRRYCPGHFGQFI